MTISKGKSALGLAALLLFTDGVVTLAFSQTNNDHTPTATEIMKKSQDTYASLSSYSDEGTTVATMGGVAIPPHAFTIKLQRSGLYRIDWSQGSGATAQRGAVWSAGHGDFLKMGAAKPESCADRGSALGGATGISGDAAGSIPGTFFSTPWGDQFGGVMQAAARKADQKIGDTDCYVLTDTKDGRTRTLWIGKQDSLIHQIEVDTSAEAQKAAMAALANAHPEMHLPTAAMGDIKSVQTHVNIVVNKPISTAQFDYETQN